ncbi:ribonuclease P protein component 2 (RNP2) [Vairimorpha necatrix]|uniref:Ribonuclease P protein component 2 (RNP2) n=1 Tax=Vairimorpha necatrix TaxID=6039 RepID=A0AAX4JAF1_9MICR
MTVRKYRYISFNFSIQENRKLDLESSILSIIRDKVTENYGENILYRLHNLALLEYLRDNNIFIIRVDRDISKYVIFSLISSGEINKIKCNFRLLYISGIYKKLLKRILNHLTNTT